MSMVMRSSSLISVSVNGTLVRSSSSSPDSSSRPSTYVSGFLLVWALRCRLAIMPWKTRSNESSIMTFRRSRSSKASIRPITGSHSSHSRPRCVTDIR